MESPAMQHVSLRRDRRYSGGLRQAGWKVRAPGTLSEEILKTSLGTVIEVAYSEKDADGKHVKASENDPRIILESAKSGKTAVHKPEAVYF